MNDKPGWEAQYQIDALRADLAKAQARCAELESVVKDARATLQATHDAVCVPTWTKYGRHEPNADCHLIGVATTALASDGSSALAAVRLAQRALDEVTGGAAIYGDGRLKDDMRAEILAAEEALREAFGEGE